MKEPSLDFTTDAGAWPIASRLETHLPEIVSKLKQICVSLHTRLLAGIGSDAHGFYLCMGLPAEDQSAIWVLAASHNPCFSLQSTLLHPTKHFLHDWMHMTCVPGLVQATLFLVMEGAIASGVRFYFMVAG